MTHVLLENNLVLRLHSTVVGSERVDLLLHLSSRPDRLWVLHSFPSYLRLGGLRWTDHAGVHAGRFHGSVLAVRGWRDKVGPARLKHGIECSPVVHGRACAED